MALTVPMILPVPAISQNLLTLNQAINNGFLNRKNIQAGKSDQAIRRLQTEALYKKYWPQVSVEYTYLYNPILQTSILPIGIFNSSYPPDATMSLQFGTAWSQTAGLTVTQPLFDLSIRQDINEAKLQERIAAASQAQSEYDLASTIAQTYIEISLQESKIKSAVADTNRTFISYKLLQDKFVEKRLLKSDLNKSLINHNNAVQQFTDDLSGLIEDKVYLLFLTGETAIEKSDFITDTSFLKQYKLTSSGIHPAPEAIPELQQLELQAQLTGIQAKLEQAKRLPTLGMKGFLGANQYTDKFDPAAANSWFGLSYVGIDLKFPILFGENVHKNIQVLRLNAIQYKQQKEDKSARYAKDAFTSKLKMDRVLMQLKTQEENLALSMESIEITRARVTEGQESASTLNLDEASLQSLRAEYEMNKRQLWINWLDCLKASGQLNILWK
ncbi:MAG: TolC family protein [Bacteroidetes bacterium]|nr:TolC family protein [Bacteroidota bacterium]